MQLPSLKLFGLSPRLSRSYNFPIQQQARAPRQTTRPNQRKYVGLKPSMGKLGSENFS